MTFEYSHRFARYLDETDDLKMFRSLFHLPERDGQPLIYFCGNSLGLQPRSVSHYIEQELDDWKRLAVDGHFHARNPWYNYHHLFDRECELVGALPDEVVVMNTLTVNLHLMLVTFYQPRGKRRKILIESKAFPSDRYAVISHLRYHNIPVEEGLIELQPRKGEFVLHTEDIICTIRQHADEIALVMLGGVHYYTGQYFDLPAITLAAHQAGALVGFDLAHAVGNVPMQLHDWGVDFAVWCTYKYLNSGPGGPGAIFVHRCHGSNTSLPRFAGWWGYDEKTRFQMNPDFVPQPGAAGWQLSNAQVLSMAAHKAALDIFLQTNMSQLRKKSILLTGFLEYLLRHIINTQGLPIEIITPAHPEQRGCQLSLRLLRPGKELFDRLSAAGIVADWREPDVIRVAPVPLYNTFEEVWHMAMAVEKYG